MAEIGVFNTLRPVSNDIHFADNIFNWVFVKENVDIFIQISLIIIPCDHIDKESELVWEIGQTSQYLNEWWSGSWFNIKMSSYQYRKSHCGDKTILRPSYLFNGISYTGKRTSFYSIRNHIIRCYMSSQGHNVVINTESLVEHAWGRVPSAPY